MATPSLRLYISVMRPEGIAGLEQSSLLISEQIPRIDTRQASLGTLWKLVCEKKPSLRL